MKNFIVHSLKMITSYVSIIALTACPPPPPAGLAAADALNDAVQLPPGSFQVDEAKLIPSSDINIVNTGGGNSRMQVTAGSQYSTNIGFNSTSGITHAGIRFGNSGRTWMVPVSNTQNITSGTIDLPFGIPAELCNDLDQICHDIKCYEFAARETSSGQFNVSQSNINLLAMMCGNCDEPSCQSLLTNCISGGQVTQAFCDNIGVQLTNLLDRYQAELQNGNLTAYCKFMKDYLTLLQSQDFENCVVSGLTGYDLAQWYDWIATIENLVTSSGC